MTVHPHPREEGDARLAAQPAERGKRPACGRDEVADILGDDPLSPFEPVQVAILPPDLAHLGFEEVDLAVPHVPPERGAGARYRVDHALAHALERHGPRLVHDPGVVG